MYAYIGSRTTLERKACGKGITVYQVNINTGALTQVQLVDNLVNPSFLALSSDGNYLYSIHGDASEISAFSVNQKTGKLTFLNQQSTEGKNPVHLSIDPSGKYMVVTNHLSSNLAVLPIAENGELKKASQIVALTGPIGPHRIEQNLSKPHQNVFDPSGDFLIVPDKGLDRIFSFYFKEGILTLAEPGFIATREGSGPRHIAFNSAIDMVYAVNELDSTVTTYRYMRATGQLIPLQILSTLPVHFTANSRASEIEVSKDGSFVYVSNRGYDSIAIFSVDQTTGLLNYISCEISNGKTPRFFTLTPNGEFLYVLNEESNTIVLMNVNQRTGYINTANYSVESGSPVCMIFTPSTD